MALADLLARNRALFSPAYHGELSNHLPMCLIALARLGADDERLASFAATYEKQLEPDRDAARASRIASLTAEVRQMGRDAVLARHLPGLMPAVSAAALHGVIRLAYAILAADDDEIAHALAYWQGEESPIEAAPTDEVDGPRTADPFVVLDALRAAAIPAPTVRQTIINDLRQVTHDARFHPIAGRLLVDETSLPRLAEVARRLYVAQPSFTSLHAVTGTQAARVVVPWVKDVAGACRALWTALAATFVVVRSPELRPRALGAPPSWDAIRRAAVASDDDHAAKFVFTCIEEEKAWSEAEYRALAAHALGIAAPM